MPVINRTNLFLAAAAVSQLATAYTEKSEAYDPYVGDYCTGRKAAELFDMINELRKNPSKTNIAASKTDEDLYKWSTMYDFLDTDNSTVSNWMWIAEQDVDDLWEIMNNYDRGTHYLTQPIYVGIPRTTLTWDVQWEQLRYNTWEDYNLDQSSPPARFKSKVTDALGGLSSDLKAFTWSEGLAKAAHYKNDKWLSCKRYRTCSNNQYIAPIMPDGTTPFMRAEKFGTVEKTANAASLP